MENLDDIKNLAKLQHSGNGQVAGLTEFAAAEESSRQDAANIAAAKQQIASLASQ